MVTRDAYNWSSHEVLFDGCYIGVESFSALDEGATLLNVTLLKLPKLVGLALAGAVIAGHRSEVSEGIGRAASRHTGL